jgi:four helix bundle protein
MMFKFEELRVYQEAVQLSLLVYKHTQSWPSQYRYNLSDQLQRAALSISLNIAEGSSRTKKDFQHFLSIARGSCYECVPILHIALQLHLLPKDTYNDISDKVDKIARMLSSLKNKI